MTSLNQLVVSGKVLYLGISDTPAWIVTKANQCMLNTLAPDPIDETIYQPISIQY
jgi:aryl-alcohol dehydrogenase-like predicted oxidoreductase